MDKMVKKCMRVKQPSKHQETWKVLYREFLERRRKDMKVSFRWFLAKGRKIGWPKETEGGLDVAIFDYFQVIDSKEE